MKNFLEKINVYILEKVNVYILAIVAVVFIYSFKFLATNCWLVVVYSMLFGTAIFIELKKIKIQAKIQFIGQIFKDNTFAYKFFSGGFITPIITFIVTVFFTINLVVFIFLSDIYAFFILLIDALFFTAIYLRLRNSLTDVFTDPAQYIFITWTVVISNALFLIVLYHTVNFLVDPVFPILSPEISSFVIEKVNHECYELQLIGRLLYDFQLEINSIRSIGTFGSWTVVFVYVVTISMIPFIAIGFIIKFFVDLKDKDSKESCKNEK